MLARLSLSLSLIAKLTKLFFTEKTRHCYRYRYCSWNPCPGHGFTLVFFILFNNDYTRFLIIDPDTIVQGHRFDILEDIGCQPTTYNTLPAYFLYYAWPIGIGAVSFVYSCEFYTVVTLAQSLTLEWCSSYSTVVLSTSSAVRSRAFEKLGAKFQSLLSSTIACLRRHVVQHSGEGAEDRELRIGCL
jgi:hypothetical protein